MKMYDSHGNVVMDVERLQRNGTDLVVKGRIMGTMPVNVISRPEEIIRGAKLLSWSVFWYFPVILAKRVGSGYVSP